ncbi:PRC-barrel domain-containing protein [Chelativorans sp. EGI FJ00035]|uniref:PRC-barrel domain-containing protein n=2 Tax=Chelativorans salis TaxID=2978478 RepID=A0ABT2LLI8_9HYPH|nr:PRC-barrel domain-containing protein [Chelativorans sp. EGI FJ00035]
MRDDGYWLAGYRGYGTTGMAPRPGGTTPAAPGAAPATPATPPTSPGTEPAAPEAGQAAREVGPWGDVRWVGRPQYQIGVLYEAAYVLAMNGDQQTCETMVEATRDRYESYVAELEELGVNPEEVANWRAAEIAASEPVTEMQGRFRIEDIIGADVRNAQDEGLGSIDDVVLNSSTGQVQYVVVDYGGFFGIGTDEAVVPWERLRAIPSRNAFVLPVDRATLEQAPQLPDNGLLDPQQTGSINTDEVDAYWEDATQQ